VATADRERWDARHEAAGAAEPAPPAALRGREALLPAGGRALDVACGRGGVAVWLALRGFTVDAVDVSPVALRSVAGLAAGRGVADRVRGHLHDLDDGLPAGLAPGYDVVVCQRFRDRRLYPLLRSALAQGGLLIVTVLSRVGAGGDDAAAFRAEPGELLDAFDALRVLSHHEGDGEAVLVAVAS
jgi:SAM-dependent methyltransferase